MLTGWLAFFFSLIDVVQDELCDVRRLFISSVVVVVMCDTHTGQQTRTRWRRVLYKKRRRRRVRHIVDDQSDYHPSFIIYKMLVSKYIHIYMDGWKLPPTSLYNKTNKHKHKQQSQSSSYSIQYIDVFIPTAIYYIISPSFWLLGTPPLLYIRERLDFWHDNSISGLNIRNGRIIIAQSIK